MYFAIIIHVEGSDLISDNMQRICKAENREHAIKIMKQNLDLFQEVADDAGFKLSYNFDSDLIEITEEMFHDYQKAYVIEWTFEKFL